MQGENASLSWRAIILYGLNTATYKIALGQCLRTFAQDGRDQIPRDELAAAFLSVYRDRLQTDRPQLGHPGRLTVMERIVAQERSGLLDSEEAAQKVAREAFDDVLPRFHTVGGIAVPVRFYELLPDGGLVLTDDLFTTLEQDAANGLEAELLARWDLLEAAFELKRLGGTLANDVRSVYLERGYDRRSVTHLRAVLQGYQQDRCFYCGEVIGDTDGHVDHVIPRQFIHHDEPWNLVLAHAFCNELKSDALPSDRMIEQLIQRNEHLIASRHPLRQHLIAQLGATPEERRGAVSEVYSDARLAIPYTWEQLRGFEPANDAFFRAIVKRLSR
jgi:hypothetical protein